MFSDLISAGYTEVDSAFANESRNVGRGEKDEGYGVVFDEGDIEAGFTAELDVGAGEEVESGLLETSLWGVSGEWELRLEGGRDAHFLVRRRGGDLLGCVEGQLWLFMDLKGGKHAWCTHEEGFDEDLLIDEIHFSFATPELRKSGTQSFGRNGFL